MPKVSRGWLVIVGLFIILCTSAGLGFYGLSVYLSALNRTRGFSVSSMSGATAVYFVVSGFSGIAIARMLRSVDPRPIVIAGASIASASMFMLGRVDRIWQVYIVYAVFGIGYAATALIVSTTLVARWFDTKRAVALSIASTGLSVGGIVLTPVARNLLRTMPISHATSRIALLYLLGIVPACLIFLRPHPARYGLAADGLRLAPLVTGGAPGILPPARGVTYEEAIRSPAFLAITTGFLCALGAQVGAIAQLDKLAHERITAEGPAGRILSIIAACSVIGRLSGSMLLAKFGGRRFTFAVLALQSVALAILAVAHGAAAVTASAVLFGLVIGNVLLLHPLLLATTFGVRDYPRIYGRSQFFTTLGVAAGPFVYGYLRDHGGGYRTSYLIGAMVSAVGLFAYTRAKEQTS
jgi:MFS family permease